MKRIFIIGASVLQLPAILKAKEMGLYVGVADYNPNAVAIPYADEFYNISTIDEKGICESAKEFKADGIMTLATDMPMRSVAYTCEKLGLTGISYDTAIRATDKGEMIKTFEKANVEHPWYYILNTLDQVEEIIDKVTYPCISKPVDNAGSKGVVLIESREELYKSIIYSSANGRKGGVIVEEYLEGNEVSVEIMVVRGKVHVLQVTDKLTTGAPHFVEMGHNQPSRLVAKDVNAIKDLAIRAVHAIGINNGPAHVEIMLTSDGPKMIELGARMGGDCITTHLVPISTGVDMVKAAIDMALGKEPDICITKNHGSAIRFLKTEKGVIKSIEGIDLAEHADGVKEITFTKNIGDEMESIDSSGDRMGYVIAEGENADAAIENCEKAISLLRISVDGKRKKI